MSIECHVGEDALAMARAVRRRVFVEEQGVSEAEEMDGKDDEATHFVLTDDGTPVATARLRWPDETTVKIERVAVLPAHRGEGLGRRVMERCASHAREQGATTARLHSQRRVVGFYETLGYEVVGEPFEEAGIPHRAMAASLE